MLPPVHGDGRRRDSGATRTSSIGEEDGAPDGDALLINQVAGPALSQAESSLAQDDRSFTPSWCLLPGVRHLVMAFFRAEQGLPKLCEKQWDTLLVVCCISVFSGFDWELLPMALKQIQDALEVPEAQLGTINSVVKMGALPAIAISVYADTSGRRRALLVVASLFCLSTFATGFTQGPAAFAATQFVARLMIESKASLCTSLLLEHMDNDNRGWGLGTQQAMSAAGGGLAYIAFGILGGLQESWRVLYWLALLQLPLLLFMFRRLPESNRFVVAAAARREGRCAGVARVLGLFRQYPRRMAAAASISVLNGFAFAPGDLLKIKFMQEEKVLSPGAVAGLVLVSGVLAFLAFSLAGRLSDKHGRKRFLVVFGALATFGVIGFYGAPGELYMVFFFLQLLSGFVLSVVSNTYFGECFPTAARATAQSILKAAYVVAGIVSIYLEGRAYEVVGSHWRVITWFALASAPCPFILHFCLPETSGLDLEDISPDKEGSAAFDGGSFVELERIEPGPAGSEGLSGPRERASSDTI